MIEINAVLAMLMIEALVALVLLVIIVFLSRTRKKGGEIKAAGGLIDQLENNEATKMIQLDQVIAKHCDIDEHMREVLLKEITQKERLLYQQIIELFLTRDTNGLKNLAECVDALAEPYCRALAFPSVDKAVENEKHHLKKEVDLLSQQLAMAMSTMKEMSVEYQRVFHGTHTEIELESSSKRMFAIFQQAEHKIKSL